MPLLFGAGYIGPDPTKDGGTAMTSEAPRDLLFQFVHPNVSFGLIICEWNFWIPEERKDTTLFGLEPVKEVLSGRLFSSD